MTTSSDTELPEGVRDVLDFWFARPGDPEHGQFRTLWFIKNDDTDREITRRFGGLLEEGLRGDLTGWCATTDGSLALIVLLDQFIRNAFRGTPRSFGGDAQALSVAQTLVNSAQDQTLPPLRRAFVYLPFEHTEDLAVQNESVRLFTALAAQDDSLNEMLDYARRHRDVIQRFGRFPHRNVVLGRESTPAEAMFLKEPGSSF
jgi:uncharacterized protein (DUF924 family)